ncbi:MAG: S9 family peptidase, partial [Methanobacteriota archaeon]
LEAPEEIILDENVLAEGKKYFRIGVQRISPNHRLLAFSVDTTGGESFTLYVKDLETGELLTDEIPNTSYSVEWANDNKTLFYTILDEAKRPYQLFRHHVGDKPEKDELVYQEDDDAYYLSLYKTKDDAYLIMALESQITSECHYLKADQPEQSFKLIHPREYGMEYYVEHHGNEFLIRTNDQAINFKLMKAPVTHPGKSNWKEFIPHREKIMLSGFEVFRNHLVLYERKDGLRQIHIFNLRDNTSHYVKFPESVYTAWGGDNPEFNTNILRIHYTSLITPRTVYDYNMDTRDMELKKQEEVLGGYNPQDYTTERLFAPAPDGTPIPISIVYRKDFKKDGSHPLYLYGYGSYGASRDPFFSSRYLSLLDRGFAYAIAHIRGGGEMGRQWYEDGKLLKKKNTFTDFIACAEYLIKEKYTSPERLVIAGGSAG